MMSNNPLNYLQEKYGVIRIVRDGPARYLQFAPGHSIDITGVKFPFPDIDKYFERLIDDYFAALPPEGFMVGDTIRTQDDADRLPDFTVMVNDDGLHVPFVYQIKAISEGHNIFFLPGEDYSYSASDIYLPAKIVWLPSS